MFLRCCCCCCCWWWCWWYELRQEGELRPRRCGGGGGGGEGGGGGGGWCDGVSVVLGRLSAALSCALSCRGLFIATQSPTPTGASLSQPTYSTTHRAQHHCCSASPVCPPGARLICGRVVVFLMGANSTGLSTCSSAHTLGLHLEC